jgi:hypothetical protein
MLNFETRFKYKKRSYIATNFAYNHREHEIAPYIALSEIYDINVNTLMIQKSMTLR